MALDDHRRLEWGAALRANLEPLVTLHEIVQERIDRMSELEEALEAAAKRVEEERSQEGTALSMLSTASDDALRRARLVGVKLEAAFLEGEVNEADYRGALSAAFPQGPQSAGSTPQQRLEALERVAEALGRHTRADPDGRLAQLATEGAAAIRAANEQAKREQAEAKEAQEQLSAAQQAFDEGYLATKEILGGLLREAGRLAELRDVFPDM